MADHPNPNTPEAAAKAREARETGDSGKVRVKVGQAPVVLGDQFREPGSTFTADERSVEQALARGLVEKVERKGKGDADAV